jgi:hypothetical protein
LTLRSQGSHGTAQRESSKTQHYKELLVEILDRFVSFVVESINWEIETSCKKLSGEKDDMRCLTMQ